MPLTTPFIIERFCVSLPFSNEPNLSEFIAQPVARHRKLRIFRQRQWRALKGSMNDGCYATRFECHTPIAPISTIPAFSPALNDGLAFVGSRSDEHARFVQQCSTTSRRYSSSVRVGFSRAFHITVVFLKGEGHAERYFLSDLISS